MTFGFFWPDNQLLFYILSLSAPPPSLSHHVFFSSPFPLLLCSADSSFYLWWTRYEPSTKSFKHSEYLGPRDNGVLNEFINMHRLPLVVGSLPPPPLPQQKQNREQKSSSCERMCTATTKVRVNSCVVRYRVRCDPRQPKSLRDREAGMTSCSCAQFWWSFGYGRNCLLILSCFLCLLNDKKLVPGLHMQ